MEHSSVCSVLALASVDVLAEGSRTLFPANYPAGGFRADLDLTLDSAPTAPYAGVTARRQFIYVYANAGEYILLGSSNRANGGDILVFNPQSFGAKGSETLPASADFTCSSASAPAGVFPAAYAARSRRAPMSLPGRTAQTTRAPF